MAKMSEDTGGESSGREKTSIGGGQTMIEDCGPSRGEETTVYNPVMKKSGEVKDTGLTRSISGGKVPSLQPE